MMQRYQGLNFAFACLTSLVLMQLALALWSPPLEAPLERLLANVQRYVQQNPKDAHGHYILGRLHSLAFARGVKTEVAYWETKEKSPLDFHPREKFFTERSKEAGEPDQTAINHLTDSIRHYLVATQLAPKEALYWLGLGWVLEQGIPFADKVDAPFLDKPRKASKEEWRQQALNAYRQAFQLSAPKDLVAGHFLRGSLGLPTGSIAWEAGESILRLQKGRTLTEAEQKEIAKVQEVIATLKKKPQAITPIVFPLYRPLPLKALMSSRSVTFDLDGDGIKERWQWVNGKSAFLVWDDEGTGRITSGRQLLGSVTWWMFWRNGYEALAALDDDGNGWLEGQELKGIAIWHDRNGNGVSETGEVLPLKALGITRIAVVATNRDGRTLFNPYGIQLHDGRFLPTYDWIAKPVFHRR